jgi:hypothetical protein
MEGVQVHGGSFQHNFFLGGKDFELDLNGDSDFWLEEGVFKETARFFLKDFVSPETPDKSYYMNMLEHNVGEE